MEANLGDWIQYVGDISTEYELKFIRNFGGFWSSHTHTPAAPATEPADPAGDCDTCRFVKECTPLYLPPCYNGGAIRAAQAEREQVLLKYQNWVAKEAKMALNGETRALVVRLNSKLIKEIESLRGGAP